MILQHYNIKPRQTNTTFRKNVSTNKTSSLLSFLTAMLLMLSFLTIIFFCSSMFASAPESRNIDWIFANYPDKKITIEAFAPGDAYRYDVGEKDAFYHKDKNQLVFRKVVIEPAYDMSRKSIGVRFTFEDASGNKIIADKADVMKLTPQMDCSGDMAIPEMLSEEYNRFGIQFRGWRGEFEIVKSEGIDKEFSEAIDRIYRIQVVNNCLEPTKWEVVVEAEDYSDFTERRKSSHHFNQRRIIAHSWFNVPMEFYKKLFLFKNPESDGSLLDLGYDELSERSETIQIDFDQLRGPIIEELKTEVIEVGHQSGRKVEPLDSEEYYKKQFGLILDEKEYTYKTILDAPLELTRFQGRGFYTDNGVDPFYVQWLNHVDDVKINRIKLNNSNLYTELRIGGEYAHYEIVLGNLDLALMNEQVLCGFLFGVNTYLTNIRNNSTPHNIGFDPTQYPDDKKPYLYLINKETGEWVNNQFKGVEKVYISYDDIDKDILTINVLSYERIVPVWMAKVKLPEEFVEQLRVRRRLYNY